MTNLLPFHLLISLERLGYAYLFKKNKPHLFCVLASHEICRSDPRSWSSKTNRQGNMWFNAGKAIQKPGPGRSCWRWYELLCHLPTDESLSVSLFLKKSVSHKKTVYFLSPRKTSAKKNLNQSISDISFIIYLFFIFPSL